jgi:hypothetical protein
MDVIPLVSATVFTILTLITCGALLEQKLWQIKFEYFRLVASIIIILIFKFPVGYQVIFTVIQLISVIWFFNLQKANPNIDEN